MKEEFVHNNKCKSCDGVNLVKFLDLGSMPPANAFLPKDELNNAEDKFPLAVYFCQDCAMVQLLDVVDQDILFGRYNYLTSASKPLVDHFIQMGNELVNKFIKSRDDLVVEIGGNDGVLVGAIKDKCRVLNVEPASNIAEISREKGIETINKFFNKDLVEEILKKYGNAKVIVANNVMAHIDDLKSVFEGIKILIGGDGVFVFEVHWVGNLLGEGGFDQIYHEHLYYHSLISLRNFVKQFGLNIFDIETVPIHGESMRVYVSKNMPISENVEKFLTKEKQLGLDRAETFLNFSKKVEDNKIRLKSILNELKKENKKIIGYGAPAKGNTLLNYFEIDSTILGYIIDTTPLKQGMYTPGTHIIVSSPDRIKEELPDYILLLAWNYADAILNKEKELRERGVKFIIPVPEAKIV